MPNIRYADASNVIVTTPLVQNTEAPIATTPMLEIPNDNCRVCIICYVEMVTGGAQTSFQPVVRRGTTATGTTVASGNQEGLKAAAGSSEAFVFMCIDTVANIPQLQYSFNGIVAGANSGTVQNACIFAYVL